MQAAIYLLVMVNPFSQVLYMWDPMNALGRRDFASVYWNATCLSTVVFCFFAITGEYLFNEVFRVSLEAFRIFGGAVIVLIALRYYTAGAGSNLLVEGQAVDLAPRISLPYMVGPGTIWVSISLGRTERWGSFLYIFAVMLINFLAVSLVSIFASHLRKSSYLFKYFEVLMKTNALFIGAIGVQMILSGLGVSAENVSIPTKLPSLTVVDAPHP